MRHSPQWLKVIHVIAWASRCCRQYHVILFWSNNKTFPTWKFGENLLERHEVAKSNFCLQFVTKILEKGLAGRKITKHKTSYFESGKQLNSIFITVFTLKSLKVSHYNQAGITRIYSNLLWKFKLFKLKLQFTNYWKHSMYDLGSA